MVSPFRGLGFVDQGDVCKRRALTAFNRMWKDSRNERKAFRAAMASLESCIQSLGITNAGAIAGLRAEVTYYRQNFQSQSLTGESASGQGADFRGIIRGRPAAIDVTTNPAYKKREHFAEIKEAFSKKWDYYVGVVDNKDQDSETTPLLLPVCDDGTVGHFILMVYPTEMGSLGGPDGMVSDRQVLIRFNPEGGDDDSALEKVLDSWSYNATEPTGYHTYLMHQAQYPEIYPSERAANGDFQRSMARMAFEFRQESGLVLSAIVGRYGVYYHNLDESEDVTRLYWVHPHPFVRKDLGKPLDMLDYDIMTAGY